MARPAKPPVSSDEDTSDSSEGEQLNDQVNGDEDEEELQAVAYSASSDDDEASDGNPPDSDENAASSEGADGKEEVNDLSLESVFCVVVYCSFKMFIGWL